MGVRVNGVWHEELADPGTGGSDSGNGRNYSSMSDYSAASGGPSGGGGGSSGGGSSGGGGGGGGNPSSAASSADAQLSALIRALSATNEQDFQQQVSQYNQTLAYNVGGLMGTYQGQPTLAGQQQQFQQGVTAAGLTGQYNGQETLAGQTTASNIATQQAQTAQGLAGLTGWYNAPGSTPGGAAGGGGDATSLNAAYTSAKSDLDSKVAAANTAIAAYQADPGNAAKRDAASAAQDAAYQADKQTHTAQDAASSAARTGTSGGAAGGGQGTQTLAGILQQANLSGQYNGAPTEAARQFNTTTGVDLAKLSSSLTGPQDYFKYLTSLNQGRSIMGALGGGAPMPQSSAPSSPTQPQSIQNILQGLGIGQSAPQPGTVHAMGGVSGGQAGDSQGALLQNPQQAGGGTVTAGMGMNEGGNRTMDPSQTMGARQGQTQQGGVTIPGFESFGSLPNPNQINPAHWDSLGTAGQQFMTGAYQAAGFDPTTLTQQINAQRPAGQYGNAAGGSSSAGPAGTTVGAPSTGAFG